MRPLFVDGPWKGRDEEVSTDNIQRGLAVEDSGPDKAFGSRPNQPVIYHFHQFVLLGHVLIIGSVQTNLQAIAFSDMKDLFDVVTSDRAKAAQQQ